MKGNALTPWRRIALYLLAGAAALAALIWAFLPKPVTVETAWVTQGSFLKTVDEDGKTRARERYVVSAPIPGRLLRVTLKAGAPVEKGRLLAVIVPTAPGLLDVRTERELSARLGAAQAERRRAAAAVERARVALEQARADLESARLLAEKGFIPLTQLERNEREVQSRSKELSAEQFALHAAGHQVEQAQAALLRMKQEAEGQVPEERFEIHSPVSGQVLRVIQESEAAVAVGQPILEIADPNASFVFGIPGDSITAIAIGVLYLKGMNPGPTIFLDHPENIYAVFIVFFLANILMVPLGLMAIKLYKQILRVPRRVLMPIILAFCMVGAFAINNTAFDIGVMLAAGVIAFFMERNGFPIAPAILGVVLGGMFEENFATSMIKADGNWLAFFERPIAGSLGVLTLVVWLSPLALAWWRARRRVQPI